MNVYLSALLVALVLTSADQSLRDTARAHGGVATNSIDYFEPVTSVTTLVTRADYVVHARMLQSRTVLTFNDMLVATEYTILPLEVLKQRPLLNVASRPGMPPNAAVVRRVGGTMVEGQYRYSTTDASLPEEEAPKIGDEVIWFLRYDQENAVFNFAAGAFSAFKVTGGQVNPQTKDVAARRGDVPAELANFLGELRRQNAKH